MTQLVAALIAGVAQGVPFFLAAAGLSLIFGVMGVLNFAQGGLFMLGAYLLQMLLGGGRTSLPVFLAGVLGAALITAVLGAVTERTLFAHTYRAGPHALIGLLVSFGLLLVLTGAVPYLWGTSNLTQAVPEALAGRWEVFGAVVSRYSLFQLVCGAVLTLLMYLLLARSPVGKTIVAVATDRQMAGALGIRTWSVSMLVFALAGALAGFGGALIAPVGSINADIGQSYLLYAFVAMVVGGLDSISGTFLGAMIIGIADSLMVNYLPALQPFAAYLAAAVVLALRPRGLFPGVAAREA